MQVKLKVIGGKNDSREITIAVPEFIIGRGDEAHLKPGSDLISRTHCSLKVENGSVTIADLGSRNGTYVNGVKLEGPHQARSGDTLRVGRLQFEVMIDHARPGNKKPKVEDVAEAAARTASGATGPFNEDSITDWLSQNPEESARSLQETQQFSLEETPTKMFARSDEVQDGEGETPTDAGEGEESESESKIRKKRYKKLPPREKIKAESSKGAADDVLRKFFNRR